MLDALTDILERVRLRGTVFSVAELDAPWAVESGVLATGIFHAVVRGACWLRTDGDDPLHLGSGDLVLVPFGDNHVMADRPHRKPGSVGFSGTADDRGLGLLTVAGDGPRTTLLCGTVEFEAGPMYPGLSTLPRVITVPREAGRGWVQRCIEQMHEEVTGAAPGSDTVVARLTEVLIVHGLRYYIAHLTPGDGGLMRALSDPVIGAALSHIHSDPARPWTLAALAGEVGLSRSSFFARFRRLVGETPGEYITRWRMVVAARILREEEATVASTARLVGYATEAAFSNAFLRTVGIRPGAYRKTMG